MNTAFKNKIVSTFLATVLAAVQLSAAAFDAPAPDSGAAEGISSGGEWSIYASKVGSARNTTAITNASDKGTLEVTASAGFTAQMQFDLSTMLTNSAATGKVLKSAKLQLTPMVSRSGIKQMLYTIDNSFQSTAEKVPVTSFGVPRRNTNDFFSDSDIIAMNAASGYPTALSEWQTDIDVTGDAIGAGDAISFDIEYLSGNTEKTEYATSNIAANGRLNSGKVPLLYNGGITDYSKWVYPQLVFEYTESDLYKAAYTDFEEANKTLSKGIVSEESGILLDTAKNGSVITLEMYDDAPSPIKIDGTSLVFNDEYIGNDTSAYVRLTVSKTDSVETASYSRIISVPASYTQLNIISFDSSKNSKGEPSIISGGKTYKSGTAYAKTNGTFIVDGGANDGYTAITTVKNAENGDIISPNTDGSYTMPSGGANVSLEYTKQTYGKTRIAASNSISFKSDGNKQGGTDSAPNIVIGANRITFLKFDLSNYDMNAITEAEISINGWNTGNTKAIFRVPNNEWDESSISKNFCISGEAATSLSAFAYDEGTISLLNGTNIKALIVPDENDISTAANGILGDYYIGSSGASKSDSFIVTDAVKAAAENSSVITLMLYSAGSGRDASSVMYADTISARPSLTITESSENLPDSELITEIETADDLKRLAEIVNGGNSYIGKTVTLHNDIDLSNENNTSWEAIGSGLKPFGGTFDGAEHNISGLYINGQSVTNGLFGFVSGSVKNLSVSGSITASSVIGGIAAQCSGEISNCHSNVTITAEREAGGIVGTLSGGGIISDCDNTGKITINNKETYAGGIAGHNVDSSIIGCTNYGIVENGMNGFKNKLGGIVGYLDNGQISMCYNSADTTSNAEFASYTGDTTQNYVGGIAGYCSYGDITGCYNSGRAYNDVEYCGGVVGYLSNGTISRCGFDTSVNSDLDMAGFNFDGDIAKAEEYSIAYTDDVTRVLASNAGEYTVILAAYNENGILTQVDVKTETFLNPGVQKVISTDFEGDFANTKAMLWNDITQMNPLCTYDN